MLRSPGARLPVHWMVACSLLLTLLTAPESPAAIRESVLVPSTSFGFDPQVPAPAVVLGFPAGSRVASQDQMVAWFEALAAASDRVSLLSLGDTHEGRQQIVLLISSPRHLLDLNRLRMRHLDAEPDAPLVSWHGFTVHGDESGGAQAAMLLAWYLAASRDPAVADRLERIVVIIDPLQNPDGYVRFSRWLDAPGNPPAVTRLRALPEPWPGGRTNHYLADLDRDWLLLQQPETRHRVKLLRGFQPHVMTDHHETADLVDHCAAVECGPLKTRKSATKDDPALWLAERLGALAAPGEPSRVPLTLAADSFPWAELTGAVGLRLTQVVTAPAELAETELIRGHLMAALGVIEGAVEFEQALKTYRDAYRDGSLSSDPGPAGWLLQGAEDAGRESALLDVLSAQDVQVFGLLEPLDFEGRTYTPRAAWVVPVLGPTAGMARALLDELPPAAGLPLAMGVAATPLQELPVGLDDVRRMPDVYGVQGPRDPVAWVIPWDDYLAPAVLNRLTGADVGAQIAMAPTSARSSGAEITLEPGAIVVRRVDVPRLRIPVPLFLSRLVRSDVALVGLDHAPGGANDSALHPVARGRIGLLQGDGVEVDSAGSLAYLLEFRLGMSLTPIRPLGLSADLLGSFTHLIMPAGDYDLIPEAMSSVLADWVRHGGVLITLAGASRWTLAQAWPWSRIPGTQGLEVRAARRSMVARETAIVVDLAADHPLSFGLPASVSLPAGDWPALPIGEDERIRVAGRYASGEIAIISLTLDEGVIVAIAGNPMASGIWRSGDRLISNAVSFGELLRAGSP